MGLSDRETYAASALIIDGNPNSRSILCNQMRDFGVVNVRSIGRVRDARLMIEAEPFEIILCDYHFDNSDMSGQELLDELRREKILPFSTVFIMVTAEATYQKVVEAAESALDGYLLKPFTATGLGDRLMEARRRKRVLRDIFLAIERKDLKLAAHMCVQRYENKEPYGMYCARVGAELLMQVGMHDAAKRVYKSILESKDLPWARMGIARVQLDTGEIKEAKRTLETLINDQPEMAEAFDVLGRVQLELGELGEALDSYRVSLQLTPWCVSRLQQCGTLAMMQGHKDEALRLMDRAVSAGLKSKLFDALTLVLMGFLRLDAKEPKGVAAVHESLQHILARFPQSVRLNRFDKILQCSRAMAERRDDDASKFALEAFSDAESESLDMEAASNML